jgi:amino acid adenylation domain-containing protein
MSFCVVLVGPDGSGKSTVARGLLDRDDLGFAEQALVRWSFQVLPPLDRVVDWFERHVRHTALPDPAHNGMFDVLPVWQSALIVAYHAVDMGLARFTVLRRARTKAQLFVFDRSFLDYYFLMGHQRLAPWYLTLLSRLVPEPDLLFYVRRSAEAIYRDKPELTLDEIARQQTIIERLVQAHPRGVTLDADAGVARTVDAAAAHIRRRTGAALVALGEPAPPAALPRPSVIDAFGRHADAAPDAVALAHGSGHWSYETLRRRAWRIAAALERAGVAPADRVAVHGARSPGLVAAMLGVWRCGATLLVIDPTLPTERRSRLVDAAGVSHHVYIVDAEDRARGADEPADDAIRVDARTGALSSPAEDAPARAVAAGGDRPAYIFFTSGSTGTPKGVLGSHDGLAHFLAWQRTAFGIGPGDRVAFLTSVMFDVMLRDVLLPLTSGATLVIPSSDEARPDRVLSWLQASAITAVHAVPSLTRAWLGHAPATAAAGRLRYVFFAGEPLAASLVTAWRAACPGSTVVNLYGPTETTLAKCAAVVPDPPAAGVQAVGRPLPDTEVILVSVEGRRCATGEAGEILIRTQYRSLGYVGGLSSDAARFHRNPFSDDPRDIVYRTGDLGRLDADGAVHVLGRLDDQVKIRGARVEPAEVEAAIREAAPVSDVAVVGRAMADGEMALVAYIVPSAATPDATTLRHALEARLPSWLVPSHFVSLDTLPLNGNGKLDRQRLHDPVARAIAPSADGPATPTEQAVADAWTETLGFAVHGRDDDFFTHGGNSLKALLLASRLAERGEAPVAVGTVYARPTIAAQAAWIDDARRYDERHVEQSSMVFGEGRPHRAFAFPPLLGYGLAYHRLARFVGDYTVVAFDFPDEGDPIDAYVAAIERAGPGPHVFIGYSAGGNLAFEVTRRLEALGRRIDAIVMLDARRITAPEELSEDEIDAIVRGNLTHLSTLMERDEQFQQYVRNDYALGRMAAKMRAFLRYERGRVNDGVVDADIHFIHSAERSACQTWATATRGRFTVYDGHGRHVEMGHGATAQANGELVARVLSRIAVDAAPAARAAASAAGGTR